MKPVTNRTGYLVIDEILEGIAPKGRCTCHQFIRSRDGQCPVHGFVRQWSGEDESQPALAVSQARDGSVSAPHAVIIDQTDTPVALVYGRDEVEARERAERAVVIILNHWRSVNAA